MEKGNNMYQGRRRVDEMQGNESTSSMNQTKCESKSKMGRKK